MRARTSPERLQEIRKELGDDKFFNAVASRKKTQIDLLAAQDRLRRAERILAYHRSMNNPHGVAKHMGEKLFAESLVKTLQRRLEECRR